MQKCTLIDERHPLEEGKHAAESGMDLKAYCEASGKVYKTLYDKVRAWRVYSVVSDVLHMQNKEPARKAWRQLGDIDAAPRWLWSALVSQMIEASWTVAVTRACTTAVMCYDSHMTSKVKSEDARRQRAWKARQRREGFALIAVWVPAEDRARLHDFARTLREAKNSAQRP